MAVVATRAFYSPLEVLNMYVPITLMATIVKDGTQSNGVLLAGRVPLQMEFPSGWKSTSPVVRVSISDDNVTYYPLYTYTGTGYTVPAVADKATSLRVATVRGSPFIKLHSTTVRGTAVTQGTICPIRVICALA